jgi:ethanolamine phosphate transferase 2 subunit G
MFGLSRITCTLANIFSACAVLLFAAGFFPHKAFLPGLATWPLDRNASILVSPFDKVIFMVVDALRR